MMRVCRDRRPIERGVHVHDDQSTILHRMGIDPHRVTYRYAGHDFGLTGVYGNVIHDVLT